MIRRVVEKLKLRKLRQAAQLQQEVNAHIAAQPIVLNPALAEQVSHAMYRADAIGRDFEQRRAEGRPPHPDRVAMCAEAMQLAWFAVSNGVWTQEQAAELQKRLFDEA